jgi:hypothetical protein
LAANYSLAAASLTADITAASLTISGVTANDKVYDGTTVATLGGTAAVSPLGTDVVGVGGPGVGAFATHHVGAGKAVSVTGFILIGADAGNYSAVQPLGLKADIFPLPNIMSPALVTPGLGPTLAQALANTTAQLESQVLWFPASFSTGALIESPTIAVTSHSRIESDAARDASVTVPCSSAVDNTPKCSGAAIGPLLRVVDGGMRLPSEEVRPDR